MGTSHAAASAFRGAGPQHRPSRRRVRRSGDDAVINLGYPWWSLAALGAPALLLFHVLHGRPHRARHGVRHHRPPDGGLYRNPDRLALFVFLIYGDVFGLPLPL